MTAPSVLLYTRDGCHLCEDARRVLLEHRLALTEIDIDSDAGLIERYGQCVPVVVVDGRERFRGHVDGALLRRLLAGRKP